jgi:polar amino acid transport system substrate-binding protein
MKALSAGWGFILAVAFSGIAHAASEIAVDVADPPFMYEADGHATGLYPTLIAEAYRRIGIAVSLQAMPWKRALEGADEARSGVGGLYKTTDRLEKYDYSEKLFDEVLEVYVRKGEGFAFATPDDLKGRTIGVIRGWSYGDAFDTARRRGLFTVEEAAGDDQNFAVLAAGHIECILAIRQAAAAMIAARHLEGRVEALARPLSINPAYLAFNKSSDKRDELRQFDAAIDAMRADGSFASITASMLGP